MILPDRLEMCLYFYLLHLHAAINRIFCCNDSSIYHQHHELFPLSPLLPLFPLSPLLSPSLSLSLSLKSLLYIALNQVGISVNRALEESGKNQQQSLGREWEKISKQSIEPSGYQRQQSLGRKWKKSANRVLKAMCAVMVIR
jgi:hypothetical protein